VHPAELFKLLRGRAEKVGYTADYRIKALTDLAALVAKHQ
jgi:hypothetical protein